MLHPFFFLSFLQISVGYVTVKVFNKHLVGKSVQPLWGTEEPNMIGEQILELRDGLSTFQETTFEYLYDKKVGWTKGAKPSDSKSSIDVKTKVVENVEIVAPVIVETVAAEVIIEEPIVAKILPSVMVKPIVAKSPEVNKDVIAVRDIPIRPKPEIDEELDAELKKKAIMKAQQAVTQSFLSLKNELPIQVDGGDIFSFSKNDDFLQKTADGSLSTKETPKSSRSEPTSLPAGKESAKSDITLKSVAKAMSSSEAPPGGFFGFLKQSTVVDEIPIVSSAKIVANRVTPPIPPASKEANSKIDEKKSTNDMFGSMSKDLNSVMAGMKGTSSINAVPVNSVSDIKAAPKQDVAKATQDLPTVPSPGGGLFGFLKSPPSATITKSKVAPPVVPPSPPALVQQVVADSTAAPKGGFFGLLSSPSAARNAPVVTKIAPTVETKEKARVIAKASAPVTQAAAPTAAQDSGKGLFSFFNKKEEISAVAVTAKTAESSKSVAAAVGMNAKFQSTVLKLLKGDNGKVKAFQRATDDFRSGDVSGEAFIQTLETLFGSDALELVVTPLVSELPERTMAVKLKVAYDKNVAALKASSSPKASFSFSFPGQGPKKVTSPSPAVLVLPVVEKKPISSKLKSLTPAPAAPVRTAVFRVPSKVPIGKKVSIERQMKSLLVGSIDATTFYTSISKELGKEKMVEVISDIIIAFPADIRTKLDALNRSNK